MGVETVKDNLELVGAALGILGALGGFGITLAVWLWKLSQWIKGIEESKTERDEREADTVRALGAVRDAVLKLEVKLDEREKSTAKLEGTLEATRGDLKGILLDQSRVMASVEKLWATVERPRRLSDKT